MPLYVHPAEQRQCEADRQTKSLAALALVLALVVLSLFLARELRSKARLEDCLLSGRTNCASSIESWAPR